MSLPEIVTRDEWLAARTALLEQEKELTRRRDALSAERRRLPMVEITKDYRFTGPEGEVGLADLFEGRRQLLIYHFMFGPDWEEGCPSCSAGIDELSPGFLDHLHTRDTTFALVSRAPLEKLEAWKAQKGWDHLTWYSSGGSDFNYDFGVTVDPAHGAPAYNYRDVSQDPDWPDPPYEMPGAARSCAPTTASSTPTRSTPAGSSRPAVRTTSSTSPRSAGKRTGRSRRAGPTARAPLSPTSRPRRRGRPGPWRRMRPRGAGSAPASDRRRCAEPLGLARPRGADEPHRREDAAA